MFFSAICSPIKGVQNRTDSWKPGTTWQAENNCHVVPGCCVLFYQSTSCWTPVKSFGPKSRIQCQCSVRSMCSLFFTYLGLTFSYQYHFYYKNNCIRCCFRWGYLTHNCLDWKMVVNNSSENSSEIAEIETKPLKNTNEKILPI